MPDELVELFRPIYRKMDEMELDEDGQAAFIWFSLNEDGNCQVLLIPAKQAKTVLTKIFHPLIRGAEKF
jgi:hypothetical protein